MPRIDRVEPFTHACLFQFGSSGFDGVTRYNYENSDKHLCSILDSMTKPTDRLIVGWEYESFLIIMKTGDDIFTFLYNEIEKRGISPNQISLISGNFKFEKSYNRYCSLYRAGDTERFTVHHFEIFAKAYDIYSNEPTAPYNFSTHKRDKHFMSLNWWPKRHRVGIVNEIRDNKWDIKCDYSAMEFETLMNAGPNKVLDFRKHSDANSHSRDMSYWFNRSYFSIISETHFDTKRGSDDNWIEGNKRRTPEQWDEHDRWFEEGFITEKTFKAIYYMHPFILVGGSQSLKRLKQLGFKTFEAFGIDESYDKYNDPNIRWELLIKEWHKLMNCSLEELHERYIACEDIFLHNRKTLQTLISDEVIPCMEALKHV